MAEQRSRVASLINRRDVTQERQQRQYAPQGPSDNNPELVTRHLRNSADRLKHIAEQLDNNIFELCLTDAISEAGTGWLKDFPAPGITRRILQRTGLGWNNLSVPTTGIQLLVANDSRVGCTVINSGTNAIILYLSDQQRPGIPTVWLAASGGAWDGRFANNAWCGNVFAVAQTGASSVCGGEL